MCLCEQTTAENWRTAAAAIMWPLCVKRACVVSLFIQYWKTKTFCLFSVFGHKQISSMTMKMSSPKLHNAPLI